MITDFEVQQNGKTVYQKFFTGQNFGQGQSLPYGFTWTPSAAGAYSLDVGIFAANWSNLLYWQNGIATVNAAAQGTASSAASSTTATSGSTAASVSASNSGATTTASASASATATASASTSGFYVDPDSDASAQAAAWSTSDPIDAARMDLIAAQPQATWFGGWNANVTADVNTLVGAAQSAGKTPVLVAYNIPDRDCGGFSAGGAQTPAAYQSWIQAFAQGIGSRPALVILEPDALASIDCLTPADQQVRYGLLSYAVRALKLLGQAKVYLDAGNSNWIGAGAMASRLQQADVAAADGFSLNVSNFYTTGSNIQYGEAVSSQVGGKHFVIDTSRNGNGSDGQWCNPPGRALGVFPTVSTGNSLADAFLWIKIPGESDGTCNGGPSAGTWWPQYAVGLAQNAGY
ncbi:MAG: glycoside hydrolase family 6 protein [Patescibacteria group bacterium]|nr:glycoside hydrolase family 6 protein [Patescibacteria group bacterium]